MLLIHFFIAVLTPLSVNSGSPFSEHAEPARYELSNPSPSERGFFPPSFYMLNEDTGSSESQKAAKNRLFFSKTRQAAVSIKTRLRQRLQRRAGAPKNYFFKYIRFRVLRI
jgi:hypothetical protein